MSIFLLCGACGSDDSAKANKPVVPAAKAPEAGKGDAATPPKKDAEQPVAGQKDADKAAPKPAAGTDAVAAMDASIATLMAKPEHNADQIKVAHILISFKGAGVPGVTRSMEEAKVLAADVYKKVLAGEDFSALMKQYSNDGGGATASYAMTKGAPPPGSTARARSGMVPAFGDVGWRLQVGEIGVAPHDAKKSPYGWHIVKRIE